MRSARAFASIVVPFVRATLATLAVCATVNCGGGGSAPAPALSANGGSTPGATATPIDTLAGPFEVPRSADAFVDAAGVNVHLSYANTFYGQTGSVSALLSSLNVRHIRDGTAIGQPSVCAADVALASVGIHLDVIASTSIGVQALNGWLSCLGTSVDAIEGPNEYDATGAANWASDLTSYMRALASATKPAQLYAPALTSEQSFQTLGPLTNIVTAGNVHDYFAGRNPGTAGWGGTDANGTYGSLSYNLHLAALVAGTQPVVATETGYSEASDTYAVPAPTKMRYVLRTLLEHWNAGVARTYLYELADEGGTPFSHYGLVDSAGNPKAAFVALKNMLGRLSDPGSSFALTPLHYALDVPAAVHHTLLQRRSGAYQLVLWVEQPEWDPITGAPIAVPVQSAQLTFAHIPAAVATTTFDDAGNVQSRAQSLVNAVVSVPVTAAPAIVDITL